MSTAERYAAIVADLAAVDVAATDGERIESLTWLERIKSAAAAAGQARLTDSFAVSQREKLIKAGAKGQDASRSITALVALARRDSPHRGGRHVGPAATLVHEMPGVLAALGRGETSEWRCTVIARETAHLSREQRAQIDAAIVDRLHGWGEARTEREVRAWAQRLDAQGAADRARKAETDRRVTIRPAPHDLPDRAAADEAGRRRLRGAAPRGDGRRGAPRRAPLQGTDHGRHSVDLAPLACSGRPASPES